LIEIGDEQRLLADGEGTEEAIGIKAQVIASSGLVLAEQLRANG
jgi:hypothetical protein